MWFKDGSRVEVLRKKHGAYGSWFPAKIVSKIGWFVYIVRYELYLNKKGGAVEEDVHERDIRPCPPIAGGGENWVLGDVAEVFDLRSWRVGRIVKVLDKNYFVVRLLGSDKLKKFHVSNLRVRHAWHNDRWMLLGKIYMWESVMNGCVTLYHLFVLLTYGTYAGMFVVLALHFDVSRGKHNRYFNSAFFGYTLGVVVTIVVMNWFQAARPALLYIVPGVIGSVAVHCLWNGEVKAILEFEESTKEADSNNSPSTSQDGDTKHDKKED